MFKVLTMRIEAKAKHLIGKNQLAFRKGCGTRDAIRVMRTLCEKSLKYGNEVNICFVDFEKAFDRVDRAKMFKKLKYGEIYMLIGGMGDGCRICT